MRFLITLSAVSLFAALPAMAQVTVDLHALQALPERPATSPAPHPSVAARPTAAPAQTASRTMPDSVPGQGAGNVPAPGAANSAAPAPALPAMPENVPNTASINPIAPPEPPAGAAPPPPPPVSDTSGATAAATAAGLRLTFAAGESTLSPESLESIKDVIARTPPGDSTTFSVLAYAPGKADDPSTARRLSLSRAMAVRSALVADGVPSPRIFVRAMGDQYGEGPTDRADLSIEGANAQAAKQ